MSGCCRVVEIKMAQPIGVAVIGCGNWGPKLARNLDELPEACLAAICDLDSARLTQTANLHKQAEQFTDYQLLLQDPRVEAVVVATPAESHHPIAKASLLAGKHTLIEKPMALSSDECDELIEIASLKGLTLMVGHTYLFSAAVRKISEIIQSGELGELKYIHSQRLNLGIFQKRINVTWDLAPHDLSIILHVFGEFPLSIHCVGNSHLCPGIEDVTYLSLDFSNNRHAMIHSSWLEPRKVRHMTFVGTRKMIVFDDSLPVDKVKVYDTRVEASSTDEEIGSVRFRYHEGGYHAPSLSEREPLSEMCGHFIHCIRTGMTPISSGEKGLELVRLLESSSRSLKRNAPLPEPAWV